MKHKELILDYFENDGELLDVTIPLQDFEYIINNGIEKNKEFFETLSRNLSFIKEDAKLKYDKEEIN